MYLALVRPILKYGQQTSLPYLRRDIALIERIQRLVTRMVENMRKMPYEDKLRRLNSFSLDRGNLSLAYNIFHGRLDLPQAEFSRLQRGETFEDTTSSYVTAVFAYSAGKQPSHLVE